MSTLASVCGNCGKRGQGYKRCARCKSVRYCSAQCQTAHWQAPQGAHKHKCLQIQQQRAVLKMRSAPAAGATAGASTSRVADDDKHLCPICLDNRDDYGQFAMCFKCGQTVCGACKPKLAVSITKCPVCRYPNGYTAKEAFELLWSLVHDREPGRHTALAQWGLGQRYYKGEGVAMDKTAAAKWFRLSADQGVADGQYNLGQCYLNGHGVPQDIHAAAKWFKLAADQGHAQAQNNCGRCYLLDNAEPRDIGVALKWFRLAADQGVAQAQCNLGECYSIGYGVPQSSGTAIKWYRLAADQGHAFARQRLLALGVA